MKIRNKSNSISLQGLGVLLFILLFFVSASAKTKLVILHTNDTHSQVEPTEKTSAKNSDMGGYARRMGVINQIRSQEKNVILLDAGDFSQGTPYYNFYNGRIEIDAMNRMKYDAGTLGNHEFDNGIDTLAVILKEAKFPIVCSNYKLTNSPLANLTKPYHILKKNGLKIGIMGLCIDPKGLIIENNYVGVEYKDAIESAKEISEFLKMKEKCDVIICLSHLGADSAKSNVTDYHIARSTKYIDVIIGGHSHEIIENTQVKNADGRNIVIAQMGKSGVYLGKIELELDNKNIR